MKKIYLLGLFTTMCLAFTSCSNEEVATNDFILPPSPNKAAYETLMSQIDSVAVAYYGTTHTRSFWSGLWSNAKKVLIADAIGAAKGLIKGSPIIEGAACSLGKVVEILLDHEDEQQTDSVESPVRPLEYSLNDIVLANSGNYVDSIGYYHNRIIQRMFPQNSDISRLRGITTTRLVRIVDQVSAIEDNGLEQEMFEELIEDIAQDEDIIEDGQYDFFSDSFEDFCEYFMQEDPQTAPQLITIARYIDNLQNYNDHATMKAYSEQVINLVNQSTISDDSKEIIKVGLSVAFASAHLWIPQEIDEVVEEELEDE